MDPEIQLKPQKVKRKNIILIALVVFSLAMAATAAGFTYLTLESENVYNGVYINSQAVGGLTRTDLEALLNSRFQDALKGRELTLKTDRVTDTIKFTDLKVGYDIGKAANEAFAIGRTGSIFDRLYDIFKAWSSGITVSMPMSYNTGGIDAFIEKFYKQTFISVKEADLLIQADKVTLRSGSHGENIEKNEVRDEAVNAIKSGKGGVVKAKVTITSPSKLDADKMYKEVSKEPENASFTVENGIVKVMPQVIGRKIDKAQLASIAASMDKTENTEKVLPVEFTNPEITTDLAYANLFKDVLGKMSTRFSTSTENDRNRGENIGLAAAKINGKILLPGEVFTFNGTVGPRTADGGYQLAHTYTAGKVVDGIGGGICQVSTTLYNAVLKADLNVIERRNHMFTVAYVPFGQDATVSYGTTDFRFKNSTRWPMRIDAVTSGSSITFTLTGTNETPDKKVIITNQTIKTTPFTTKYINDPTLAEGKTSIKQEGKNGYVIDTFKTVKDGARVVSETKLYTSTYQPLVQEVLKGTKKVEAKQQPAQAATQQAGQPSEPTKPAAGVDDADNPPAPPSTSE